MSNKKPVAAHYISSFLPLTENWIYKLLINHKNYKPIVITRSVKNQNLFPFNNIYSLATKPSWEKYLELIRFKMLGYIPFFKQVCKKEEASILHVHFGYQGIKSLGLKRKLGIPMVCSFYGYDVFKLPKQKKYRTAYKKLFQNADKLLVLGPYMKNELISLGCPDNKIEIQHLGIDTQKIKFKSRKLDPNNPIKILLASSFVEKKGIDITIKALGILKKEFHFKVEIIGDGFLKESIVALIKENNLENDIVLHGYKPYDFFIDKTYECDIFVQASKTTTDNDKEGTPMSIVDVMASGMPVVSTRHSDIPEIVIDGYNGYLAEENSVDDLVKCLRKIINTDNFEELSKNARKHIEEQFDASVLAVKLESIYNKLINNYQR